MELKEFIAESLKQLVDGVGTAQEYAKDKGASINPAGLKYGFQSGKLEVAHDSVHSEIPRIVEFDIAITVSESGEAKAGLAVFAGIGVGTHATMQDTNIIVNRMKFDVPVLLPKQHNS